MNAALPNRHVECANCKQQVDVTKYMINPPGDWSSSKMHIRRNAGFAGAVRCPECSHLTIYTRGNKTASRSVRVA